MKNLYTHRVQLTLSVFGKIALLILCSYFSWELLTHSTPWIFPDNVNVLIHEAGHFIFLPFGQFMQILGGSIFQLCIPLSFLIYFYRRKEPFSVFLMVFWVANNYVNIGVYMKDAQNMTLPLIGGEMSIHDWNWIFDRLGILPLASLLGEGTRLLGNILLLLSLFGMLYATIQESLHTPIQRRIQ